MSLAAKRHCFYGLYGVQILGIVIAWLTSGALQRLEVGGGVSLIAIGALCGLLAGFFFLHQMILISGAKFFEKYFGLDRLAGIHHITGFIGYGMLIAHILFIISGYAALNGNGFIEQYFHIRDTFAYITLATLAVILLDIVVIASIVIVRRRLKYELWYFVHLLVYAAVLLAVLHQVSNGQTLMNSQLLRAYWYGLYIAAFGFVLWRRWLLPLWLERKHKFRVAKVVKEAHNIVSVYIQGRDLDAFQYQAGQFNLWQFWQKGLWSMHHPFTISSSPGDAMLRLSAKAIGDFTSALDQLQPGTPVLISGPYGLFTSQVAARPKRLFIAGGIGITPIRSMLGERVQEDDVLVYAVQTKEEAVFSDEFSRTDNLKTVYVLSEEKIAGAYSGYLTKEILEKEVSAIADRDVWLCGPPVMMDKVEKMLSELNVPKSQVHTERFRL